MKSLLLKLSAIAILASGPGLMPLLADEAEGKAAVPTRGDGENGESEVYRASEVIGLPVKDDDGTEVGQIKDLVINGSSSEVLYAVVAMNEAEEKDSVYVMPWTVFQPSFGQGSAIQYTTLTIPQTVWQRAPFFPMAQWRQTPYTQWGPRVNDYYSTQTQVGARGNNRRNNVRVNKPSLREGTDGDSTSEEKRAEDSKTDTPKSDKAKSGNDASKNAEKPAAKEREPGRQPADRTKPQADAKGADKPAVKDKEPPKANSPKLPNPQNVDPAEPKKPAPAPAPNQPKPKAPNPK